MPYPCLKAGPCPNPWYKGPACRECLEMSRIYKQCHWMSLDVTGCHWVPIAVPGQLLGLPSQTIFEEWILTPVPLWVDVNSSCAPWSHVATLTSLKFLGLQWFLGSSIADDPDTARHIYMCSPLLHGISLWCYRSKLTCISCMSSKTLLTSHVRSIAPNHEFQTATYATATCPVIAKNKTRALRVVGPSQRILPWSVGHQRMIAEQSDLIHFVLSTPRKPVMLKIVEIWDQKKKQKDSLQQAESVHE